MPGPSEQTPHDDWVEKADAALAFVEDAGARAHILFRFEGQYLPALSRARSPEETWRAWAAFHYFMIVRPTRRKPFALSPDDADRVIAELVRLLDLPPPTQP